MNDASCTHIRPGGASLALLCNGADGIYISCVKKLCQDCHAAFKHACPV